MQIEASGTVFDPTHQPDHRRIAFFTSLCSLRSGGILCSFQMGSGKHSPDSTIGICRSDDGGQTWRQLPASLESVLEGTRGSLSGPALVDAEPQRLLLFATWFDRSDPARPLFDPETEGILHSRQLLAVSTDEGETWSPWQVLEIPGLTGCAATGPAIHWPDGTIAFAFESFKEFDDPRPARHGAWVIVSRDGGRTFGPPLLVAQDPEHQVYYWDQRLCPTAHGGDFFGLFWTHDRALQMDLCVHQRHGRIEGDQIVLQPIQVTSMRGQIAACLSLDSDRLLAFVVDRNRPGTMRLWLSKDCGQTWPESDSLIVHTHDEQAKLHQQTARVDFAEYWEDMGKWSFGHPALLRVDSEHVLATYYAGTPDRMGIRWARIQLTTNR